MSPLDNIWQIVGALLAVLALVAALGLIAKRFTIGRNAQDEHITVLATTYLGAKERLLLVEVEGEKILLGMNANTIAALGQLGGGAPPRFAAALDQAQQSSASVSS